MDKEKMESFYGRESFMEALKKKLLDSQSAHYLLTGKWGSGKTTIIHKLMNDINENNEGTKAILIDAWENDAFEDPNLVLMHRLFEEKLLNEDMVKAETKNKDDKLSFLPIKQVLKAFIKNNYEIDIDEVFSGFETNESRFYLDQISKMQEEKFYKKMLEDMIEIAMKEQCNQLIFCIDELDRARPDFTVRLLERYHHLRVQGLNVIFVYVSDYEALVDNIESYYGFKNRGAEYIEKMFDEHFTLPSISKKDYANYIQDFYERDREILSELYSLDSIFSFRAHYRDFPNMLYQKALTFRQINHIIKNFNNEYVKAIDFQFFNNEFNYNDMNTSEMLMNENKRHFIFNGELYYRFLFNLRILQIIDDYYALNLVTNWGQDLDFRIRLVKDLEQQLRMIYTDDKINSMFSYYALTDVGINHFKQLNLNVDDYQKIIYCLLDVLIKAREAKFHDYIY